MSFPLYNVRIWIVAVIGYLLLIEQQWKLNNYTRVVDDKLIPSFYDFEYKSNSIPENEETQLKDKLNPLLEPKHKQFPKERLYNLRYNFESRTDGI